MARIGTKALQHGHAETRTATRGRAARLLIALAAVALLALVAAGTAGARIIGNAEARPLAESAPKITIQPANATAEQGKPAAFSSTASGTPTPTEQWERSTDGGNTFLPIEGATSANYTIPSVSLSESGYVFRAKFKNTAGEVTSKTATLTVTAKPVVTQQPADATAQDGQSASFTSKASGAPAPTVQWMESTDGGATYKNVTGQIGTTLTFTTVSKSMDGWKFRAVFKNSTGEATSQAATLHIVEAPHIIIQPLEKIVLEGEPAEFHSTAGGSPSPTIQWERSIDGGKTFQPIAGATSEFYSIAATTPEEDGYRFRAVWTNVAGTATSTSALLTVRGLPKITEQPEPQVVLEGATATFEAQASGHPAPTVQWEMSSNGGTTFAPISGATSNKLTIASAQMSESGRLYRAVFKNTAGSATSEAAQLTVSETDYIAYAWGANNRGQTGMGAGGPVPTPGRIQELSFVTQVSAGGHHSLALQAGGRVFSWGYNGFGQLGNEEVIGVTEPMAIEHLSGVTQVAAGGNHSLALLKDGTVKAWGDNESGQLGNGGTSNSEVPVAVSGLSGVKAIAAGEEHSLALLSNGTVVAWGNNEFGQLGTGNQHDENEPVAIAGLTGVTAIAAGGRFSMALLENGTVVAWGSDTMLQLGNEEVALEELPEEDELGSLSDTPVPVEGLSNVKAIAAGKSHALALMNDGTVDAWGDNSKGELGNGAVGSDNGHPAPVGGLSGVSVISAGDRGSAAVLASGGAVMTWGMNEAGSLGIGETGEPSPVPVQASNIGQIVGVSYGGGHVLAFGEAGPVVTHVSPKEGAAAGGDTVTITGTNFGSASAVHFGAAAATSFTVESSDSITATAPAGTGTVDISVTTPVGTSSPKLSDHYTYRPAPTVTKLSVKGGPATGGTVVTITGTNFTGVTGVSFGGVPASEFTVLSTTSISATSPPNAGSYADIRVTGAGGTSPIATKDRFKYAPVVESISPPNGPVAGGNTVTVTGWGFIPGTATVKFKIGKGTSQSVQCASINSCTVVVPASKVLGTVDMKVTAGKGKETVPAAYTFE